MALKIFWNKIEILNSCSKTRTDKKLSAQDSGIKPGRSINGLLNLYGIGGSLDMKACI